MTDTGAWRRRRSWSPWEVLTAALGYAYLSWLPVGYLSYGDTVPHGLGRRLWWPFSTLPATLGVSLLAFLLAWATLRLPRRRGWTVLYVVGAVGCVLAAYVLYRTSVGHYAAVTDRATALQYGFEELAHGHNPYYRHTQLGNTISPMLGGLLLAGPFVLTNGTLYWQGMVWFALVVAVLGWLGGPRAGFLAGALLFLSPAFRLELVVQSDGWVNGAALALTGTALYLLAGRYRRSGWWATAYALAALGFALAFSYRFIYAVVALPLGVLIWRHHGTRALLTAAVPAGLLSAVLILGPYVADPSAYAPFQKASLGTTAATVPHLALITAVVCALVTVGGTMVTRSIAGVWGTVFAASLAFVTLTGWGQHEWYQYLTWAYNGAALVFLVFALLLPRWEAPGERQAGQSEAPDRSQIVPAGRSK